MAYSPKYTSEEDVEALLQRDISDGSTPSTVQVNDWIEQIEAEIDDKGFSVYTETDAYLDVPYGEVSDDVYMGWIYKVRQGRLDMGVQEGGTLIPIADAKHPLLTITTLEKNSEPMDSAPSWQELTQWDGSAGGTHFTLLYNGRRANGYALYIYDETPEPGVKRIKITYTWGYNVPTSILKRYCTLKVSLIYILGMMGTNVDDAMSWIEGGDLGTSMNTNWEERIKQFRWELGIIEKRHFPKPEATDEVALGIL